MSEKKKGSGKGLESRRAYYRLVIEDLTMMSDMFMRCVLKEKVCIQEVLRILLDESNLEIAEVTVQKDYKNLRGRSAVLDCVAADTGGRQFNLEVQQRREGALPERARYHSSLLDMNTLNPGEGFEALPETYVIFVGAMGQGFLPEGRGICHVRRMIGENGKPFNDRTCILYVNAEYSDDTPLGRLMHDFHSRNADDMYNPVLAEQVRRLKETEEGRTDMCEEMDRIYQWGERVGQEMGEQIGREEGKQIGREEGERIGQEIGQKQGKESMAREVARNLAGRGMKEQEIASVVGMRVDQVREWVREA